MIPTLWRIIRQRAVKAAAAILAVPLHQVCGHRGLTFDVDEAWALNAAAAVENVIFAADRIDEWDQADVSFALLNAIRSARPD